MLPSRRLVRRAADDDFVNYIEYNVNCNDKNPKFQVDDNVRISKYKNIFAKGYTPNWSEKVFVIKEVKKRCSIDICH